MASQPNPTRHVILVAGYDYESFQTTFDKWRLNRIGDFIMTHRKRDYNLCFHYWSVGLGVVATSRVIAKDYTLRDLEKADPHQVKKGSFWAEVEKKFARMTREHYDNPKPGDRNPAFKTEEEARRKEKVLSITDIYDFMRSLWK